MATAPSRSSPTKGRRPSSPPSSPSIRLANTRSLRGVVFARYAIAVAVSALLLATACVNFELRRRGNSEAVEPSAALSALAAGPPPSWARRGLDGGGGGDGSEASSSSTTTSTPTTPPREPELPVYTSEMASRAVRKAAWTCGGGSPIAHDDGGGGGVAATTSRPFFAFVHVYKTAGTTLRTFFSEYAGLCHKAAMVVVSCSGLKPSAVASGADWNDCRLKAVVDGRRRVSEHDKMKNKKERLYPAVSNGILRDNFDIVAGHHRIGSTDGVFAFPAGNDTDADADATRTGVRHIVFLRQPRERYVSSILYQARQHGKNRKGTVEETAEYIKARIKESAKRGDHWEGLFNYLLTPEQARETAKIKQREERLERRTTVAIRNLVRYNVIVGMTESFDDSMDVLRHVLLPDHFANMPSARKARAEDMFDGYYTRRKRNENDASTGTNSSEVGSGDGTRTRAMQNPSRMGDISTSSVLAELERDRDFLVAFDEYVRYERRVVDFASKMHRMQFDSVSSATAGRGES